MEQNVKVGRLVGLVTEKDFPEVELQNPGFGKWFEGLEPKPRVFLNAYFAYLDFLDGKGGAK